MMDWTTLPEITNEMIEGYVALCQAAELLSRTMHLSVPDAMRVMMGMIRAAQAAQRAEHERAMAMAPIKGKVN